MGPDLGGLLLKITRTGDACLEMPICFTKCGNISRSGSVRAVNFPTLSSSPFLAATRPSPSHFLPFNLDTLNRPRIEHYGFIPAVDAAWRSAVVARRHSVHSAFPRSKSSAYIQLTECAFNHVVQASFPRIEQTDSPPTSMLLCG